MSLRNIPRVGDVVGLTSDSEPDSDVRVVHSYGVARIVAVTDDGGRQGVIAFQPDGGWWWVRPFEDDAEPWESSPDAWRS